MAKAKTKPERIIVEVNAIGLQPDPKPVRDRLKHAGYSEGSFSESEFGGTLHTPGKRSRALDALFTPEEIEAHRDCGIFILTESAWREIQ